VENQSFPCSLQVIAMSIAAADGAAVAAEQRPRIRVDGKRQAYRQVIHGERIHAGLFMPAG
jgi:hypothetical protein